MRLAEHALVLRVVEVPEGGEPAHDRVELVSPRERAHVAFDVVHLDAAFARFASRQSEEQGSRVDAGDARALRRQAVRDAPVPAREVEHIRANLERHQAPDRLRFRVGGLVRQARKVEVQVVVVEELLGRPLVRHGPTVPILRSGAKGIRTPDLLHAMQALYQLSYSPEGSSTVPVRSPRSPCDPAPPRHAARDVRRSP